MTLRMLETIVANEDHFRHASWAADRSAKGLATRPTGDRVREAAFNLIGPVDGRGVLDLLPAGVRSAWRRSRAEQRA